jgi:hypothetical protein
MKAAARRAGSRLLRLGRLLAGRNVLRRHCDRIEGAAVACLSAAFLVASITAASFAGHLYRSEHAAAARLHPTTAVLSQPGPVAGSRTAAARAKWRLPSGTQRSGPLTPVTAPAIYCAPAGASVRVWLGRSAEPLAPPLSPGDMAFNALFAGLTITAGAAVALILCYLLCRMALDRHRLARWESAWAAVGPRWTSRR